MDLLDLELEEHPPNFWVIIDGQQKLSANRFQVLGESLEISWFEVVAIQANSVVRRVKIEESFVPVVFLQNLLVGQTLNLHTLKALVCLLDHFLNPTGTEVWALDHVDGIALTANKSTVGTLLKIKITCCPLDVGRPAERSAG